MAISNKVLIAIAETSFEDLGEFADRGCGDHRAERDDSDDGSDDGARRR